MTTIDIEQSIIRQEQGAAQQNQTAESSSYALWARNSALPLRTLRHLRELRPCLAGIWRDRHFGFAKLSRIVMEVEGVSVVSSMSVLEKCS